MLLGILFCGFVLIGCGGGTPSTTDESQENSFQAVNTSDGGIIQQAGGALSPIESGFEANEPDIGAAQG